MLAATLRMVQVLDMFQVAVEITEFQAGADPVVWKSRPEVFVLQDKDLEDDALSTMLRILALWSERTIQD